MTRLTTDATVGQLAANDPARSRVFQRLGIDFCCGGTVTLAEACQRKTLDARVPLAVPVAPVDTAADPVERLTLAQLCDHIEQTHHASMRVELPRLRAMLHEVAAVHGLYHPWVREMVSVFEPFAEALLHHMKMEERVLFPWIRRLETEDGDALRATLSIESPIEVMTHEHEEAGGALARLRTLSNGFAAPANASDSFLAMLAGLRELESDLRWLVHKENNLLFPRARAAADQ